MKTKEQLSKELLSLEHDLKVTKACIILFESMEKRGLTKLEKKVNDFIPQDSGVSISSYEKDAKLRRVFYKDIDGKFQTIDEQFWDNTRKDSAFVFSLSRSLERVRNRKTRIEEQIPQMKSWIENYEAHSSALTERLTKLKSIGSGVKANLSHLFTEEEHSLLSRF